MLSKIIDLIYSIAKFFWQIIKQIILFVLFKVLHLELSEKKLNALLQFVKFGIVGLSNTIISYLVYLTTIILFDKVQCLHDFSYSYLVGSVLGFIISVAWSFFWNNKLVFKLQEDEERSVFLNLIKTYLSYAFSGLFLSNVLLIFWIEILKISEFIAPILNLVVTVPINFVINKFWAFKTKRKDNSK